eukprot:NODE_121_length_17861_cov_0.498480.p10 type:complete len:196 gc:universal NODE_121_length_17861_cov_0.498480:12278-12865(+)
MSLKSILLLIIWLGLLTAFNMYYFTLKGILIYLLAAAFYIVCILTLFVKNIRFKQIIYAIYAIVSMAYFTVFALELNQMNFQISSQYNNFILTCTFAYFIGTIISYYIVYWHLIHQEKDYKSKRLSAWIQNSFDNPHINQRDFYPVRDPESHSSSITKIVTEMVTSGPSSDEASPNTSSLGSNLSNQSNLTVRNK